MPVQSFALSGQGAIRYKSRITPIQGESMANPNAAAAGKRPGQRAAKAVKKSAAQDARWVVYSAPKGGTGKTTSCKNTAVAAARDGMRVATLDFDPQRTLSQWHELRRPHDVARIDHYEGALEEMAQSLARIDAAAYDVVFVDTPPSVELFPEATKILLRRADLVLVPTGVGRFDKMSVIPWMEFLRDYERPAAFLLNRVKRRSVSLREAKLELGRVGRLVPHEVPDIEDMHRVDDIGCSIVDVGQVNGADECLGAWYFVRHELGL